MNKAKNTSSVFDKLISNVRSHIVSLLFFACGVAILVWTFRIARLDNILAAFQLLKGWDYAILLFYPLICFWDAWGWHYIFPAEYRKKASTMGLFFIRLAGEAVNNTTPFFDIGGEPLKVILLSDRLGIPKTIAAGATILSRALLFFSEVAFWCVGLLPAMFVPDLSADWKRTSFIILGIAVVLAFLMFRLMRKGLFLTFLRWFEKRKRRISLFEQFSLKLQEVDKIIADFCAKPQPAAAIAFLLHFISWVAGGVETYLMFLILGAPVTLWQAVTIEALLQLTRSATFFIPGNVGAQEAGMAMYASWYSMEPSIGVAVSLLKRSRQILWSIIGFAVWGAYAIKKSSQP